MKKWKIGVAIVAAVLFLFAGCATDRFYQAGKIIYVAGKQVVVANWEALPKDVQEKLKMMDKIATQYDKARTTLKPALEEAAKKVKQDVNSSYSKTQEFRSE